MKKKYFVRFGYALEECNHIAYTSEIIEAVIEDTADLTMICYEYEKSHPSRMGVFIAALNPIN